VNDPAPIDFDLDRVTADVASAGVFLRRIEEAFEGVLIGQRHLVDRLLIGLICNGHILLEGLPGLAKTLSVRALAGAIGVSFRRIQFTPDLLPADVVGTLIYNQKEGAFSVRKGPIFANLVLADEINRAPAKVQSALLEAMQERQVTIGDTTFMLEEPFLVLATQNPIEQEGTYTLPEAQVDRFMMKVRVRYPDREEELAIMHLAGRSDHLPVIRQVADASDIFGARRMLDRLYVDERVAGYMVDLVRATRDPAAAGLQHLASRIAYGASPRATISLNLASRAHAFMNGRAFVVPDDVRSIAPDVLRHRVITTFEAQAEEVTSDDIVTEVLAALEVP
jgi:MoxR-like ATPase